MTNPSPECDHPVTEKGGLDRICDECGAPIRDHMIGGPAPYHPRPIRSAPEPDMYDVLGSPNEHVDVPRHDTEPAPPPPASAVREATIEECAKIADYQAKIPNYTEAQRSHIYSATCIAKAIRALSNGTADEKAIRPTKE